LSYIKKHFTISSKGKKIFEERESVIKRLSSFWKIWKLTALTLSKPKTFIISMVNVDIRLDRENKGISRE
jgi:hypothetical protein